MSKDKYNFINILTENQSVNQNINLPDVTSNSLYRAILKISDMDRACHHSLYTMDTSIDELGDLRRRKIIYYLKRLRDDRLIAQIFCVKYENSVLKIEPCYFAITNIETADFIYRESIQASANSIQTMFQKIQDITVNVIDDVLKADLEGKHINESTYPHFILDFFKSLKKSKFEIPPVENSIETIMEDINNELLDTNKFTRLENYGIIQSQKHHITQYMKVAEDFIIDKVLPYYEKDNETLSTIVEQLSFEKKFNNKGKSVVSASNYILRLTQVIHEFALKNRKKEKDSKKYRGLLAIEIILSFNDKAEDIANSIAKKRESQIYENYYEKIIKNSHEWQDNLLIISTEEKENMSLDTWESLTKNKKVAHVKWEFMNESKWLFLEINEKKVFNIIIAMDKEASLQTFFVLMLREILDKYQNHFYRLFDDRVFLEVYSRVLRNVYLTYIPWYYHILLYFKLNFFLDIAYKCAKEFILKEQHYFFSKNEQERKDIRRKEQRKETMQRKKINNLAFTNDILLQLDDFYFVKNIIPVVKLLREYKDASDKNSFREMIYENNFQLLPFSEKNDGFANSIILYPRNKFWEFRRVRIKKIIEQMPATSFSLSNENNIRCKRVLKFIKNDLNIKYLKNNNTNVYAGLKSSLNNNNLDKKNQDLSNAETDNLETEDSDLENSNKINNIDDELVI